MVTIHFPWEPLTTADVTTADVLVLGYGIWIRVWFRVWVRVWVWVRIWVRVWIKVWIRVWVRVRT